MRHRSHIAMVGMVLASGFWAVSGCVEPKSKTIVQRADAPAERPAERPVMTPAERDRRLHDIHQHAMGLANSGRYGLALAAFEQALALKPDSVDTLFNIGACHEAMGDPMRAVRIYRRILDVTPNDPDCYANLGTSYMKMYHRENSPVWRKMARKAWARSLALNPDQPDIESFLAQTETLD